MKNYLIKLHQILTGRFSDSELRTLCFALNVEYDGLPGEGKADRARELLSHLERRNELSQLLNIGKRLRPDIVWDDIPGTEETIEKKQVTIFKNVREAWAIMQADCKIAETIAIIGNRGLSAFGTDHSLISLAELDKFTQLRKLRIILLSVDSRWLHSGFLQYR